MRPMPVGPFDEKAWTLWHAEVEEARKALVVSLDDLRTRADKFLTVTALATTMLTVLAPGSRNGGSDGEGATGPVQENGTSVDVHPPTPSRPAIDEIPLWATTNGTQAADPGPPPPESAAPTPPASPTADAPTPRAIITPNTATATAGVPFSFTVTTTGTGVTSITHKGDLPKNLTFTDNGDGTATVAGTPHTTGVHHLTIRAKFGRRESKYVVIQVFTLLVAPA